MIVLDWKFIFTNLNIISYWFFIKIIDAIHVLFPSWMIPYYIHIYTYIMYIYTCTCTKSLFITIKMLCFESIFWNLIFIQHTGNKLYVVYFSEAIKYGICYCVQEIFKHYCFLESSRILSSEEREPRMECGTYFIWILGVLQFLSNKNF